MAKVTIKSSDRMSNTKYHANGKPCWWVRIGDKFLTIPQVRGDQYLNVEVEVDSPCTIDFGCGPRNGGGIRGQMKVK